MEDDGGGRSRGDAEEGGAKELPAVRGQSEDQVGLTASESWRGNVVDGPACPEPAARL